MTSSDHYTMSEMGHVWNWSSPAMGTGLLAGGTLLCHLWRTPAAVGASNFLKVMTP